jgi:hypothetical protein
MADQEKNINVNVNYKTTGAQDAAQSFVLQGKAADEYYRKLANNMASNGDTMAKDFQAFQNQYKSGTQQNQQVTQSFNNEVVKTTTNFRALRMEARELNQIGTFFTIAGGLLTGAIVADANNYVKTMGSINSESAKWLGYQNSIKESNLQIGRVATEAMLPAMKGAADLMQKIADIVQANPWLVQGALTVGGVLTVLGITTKVIAELVKVVADVGLLLGKAAASQAASAASQYGVAGGKIGPTEAGAGGSIAGTVGTIALYAGSVILGANIGLAIGNFINKLIDPKAAETT